MRSLILLMIAVTVGAGATSEYTRTLSLSALDQAAFVCPRLTARSLA